MQVCVHVVNRARVHTCNAGLAYVLVCESAKVQNVCTLIALVTHAYAISAGGAITSIPAFSSLQHYVFPDVFEDTTHTLSKAEKIQI